MRDGSLLRQAVSNVLRGSPRVVIASAAGAMMLSNGPIHAAAAGEQLDEIVVTAQKRSQSIQDVPYNISTVSSGQLSDAGTLSMNDLTNIVPGLQTVDEGPGSRGGNNNFVLRGLRSDPPGGGGVGEPGRELTRNDAEL